MAITLPIETDRLIIRPLTRADAATLHELYSDPVAMEHLADGLPATVADSERWVQSKIDQHERTGLSLWAVVAKDIGAVVGDAGLQLLDDEETIEIGVRLVRRFWGRGYGREAAAALLDAGFAQLDVERIVGITAPGNVRARLAMETLGMRHAGRREIAGRGWEVYEARR